MDNNQLISCLLIILFFGFYTCYHIYDRVKQKDKKELEKTDLFFSIIQKTLISFFTIMISIIGVVVSIKSLNNSKTEFTIQNESQINTIDNENYIIDKNGKKEYTFQYKIEVKEDGTEFVGIPIIINNIGNVKDSVAKIDILVFDETETIASFYAKLENGKKIDKSEEVWLDPKESLMYIIDGETLVKRIEACISRLKDRDIDESNYRVFYENENTNKRNRIRVTIELVTGSGKKIKMRERSFDLDIVKYIKTIKPK